MEIHGSVGSQYRDFLASCDSPCFAQWTQGVLDDAEVRAWIATLPGGKQQPNLVYAAARWHGVPAPGPYAGLREALLGDDAAGGPVRRTVLVRATQTNEVGRMATLLPVLALLAEQEGRPLALLEAGASAGLCLYPDRWSYRWSTPAGEVVLGAGDGGPGLPCEVEGPAPLPTRLPEVAWRGGVDLNPLDVRDAGAVAWLQTLVWPEHADRRALLAHGVEVARSSPPSLVAGDLLTELPAVVERAAAHGPVVVQHSAVIAYLTDADRSRFASMMAGLVAGGACHWISNEGPRVVPGLADLAPPAPPTGVRSFLLAVDGRPVAWTHGHGRAMTWFG